MHTKFRFCYSRLLVSYSKNIFNECFQPTWKSGKTWKRSNFCPVKQIKEFGEMLEIRSPGNLIEPRKKVASMII